MNAWPSDERDAGGDAHPLIYIVAKTQPHARAVAQRERVPECEWVYLTSASQVRRLPNAARVWMTGAWPIVGTFSEQALFREELTQAHRRLSLRIEYRAPAEIPT